MSGKYHAVPIDEEADPLADPFASNGILHPEQSRLQNLQKLATGTYIWFGMCLSWNLMAVITLRNLFEMDDKILFLAVTYWVVGQLSAYLTWYRSLILAFRTENASMFDWFDRFSLFMVAHISFCIFAAVAPPVLFKGRSFAGILSALDLFYVDRLVGISYLIGFGFWCVESLLSIGLLQKAYEYHRRGDFALQMT